MLFNLTGGGNQGNGFPEFTYTGSYQIIDDGREGSIRNWRIKLLTSGTLIFLKPVGSIDAFLVGGGASAYHTVNDNSGGGGSGTTVTQSNLVLAEQTEYAIVIGAGGAVNTNTAGGKTKAFGYTANGGGKNYVTPNVGYFGGSGGSGGGGRGTPGGTDGGNGGTGWPPEEFRGGSGQGSTTREFAEADGDLYAYGGCGGGYDGNFPSKMASQNTGNGGGAGVAGASGIVIIRNARG